MKLVDDFVEYQILDMANGEKLENWNGVILRRPDPPPRSCHQPSPYHQPLQRP